MPWGTTKRNHAKITQDAFDFINLASSLDTIEDIRVAFLEHASEMGVDFIMCGRMREAGGPTKPVEIFATQHPWYEFYRKHYLFIEDRAPRHAAGTSYPFQWKDIVNKLELTEGERKVMEEPRNFGLTEGLVIPMHGAGNEFATFTASGDGFRCDETIKGALQIMANRAYQRATEIRGEDELLMLGPELSPREREALTWVREKKSNTDIAQLMNISPSTVRFHLSSIMKKLEVGDRRSAVEKAIEYKILPF
ncbi:MAG: LuxR family transcriptional regulator [Alphaproteobacteria bacterium]|nr:LuxR family transcriptional regulator [Alphaproteobacteria bacterium]